MRFFSLQQLWALKMPFLSISMFDVIEIRPRFYRCVFYHVLPCFTHQTFNVGETKNTSAFCTSSGSPTSQTFRCWSLHRGRAPGISNMFCRISTHSFRHDIIYIIGPLWNSDMFRLHDILFVGASWCYSQHPWVDLLLQQTTSPGIAFFHPSTGFI